jgi:hypothetical protein
MFILGRRPGSDLEITGCWTKCFTVPAINSSLKHPEKQTSIPFPVRGISSAFVRTTERLSLNVSAHTVVCCFVIGQLIPADNKQVLSNRSENFDVTNE